MWSTLMGKSFIRTICAARFAYLRLNLAKERYLILLPSPFHISINSTIIWVNNFSVILNYFFSCILMVCHWCIDNHFGRIRFYHLHYTKIQALIISLSVHCLGLQTISYSTSSLACQSSLITNFTTSLTIKLCHLLENKIQTSSSNWG